MKMKKRYLSILIAVFFILLFISNVSALVGKISNGRVVLNLESGEDVKRTVGVINDNDVPINVTLTSSGDLKDDIEIIDNNFILEPGEEFKARFGLTAPDKPGTYTGRVNVLFAPLEGGNSVGLSSVITLNVIGDENVPNDEEEDVPEDEDDEGDNRGISLGVIGEGNQTNLISGNIVLGKEENSITSLMPYLAILVIILLAFLVVLFYYSRTKRAPEKMPEEKPKLKVKKK